MGNLVKNPTYYQESKNISHDNVFFFLCQFTVKVYPYLISKKNKIKINVKDVEPPKK